MSETDVKHKRTYARVEMGELKCEAIAKNGDQCRYIPVPGSKFCIGHGGRHALKKEKDRRIRMYRLAKWQDKMEHFSGHSDVKGLREEIGILRVILEERMNICKDSHDLILQSHAISDLVMKIERVVFSCHKLESSLGQMLDKQSASQFASEIVEIIHDEVNTLITKELSGEEMIDYLSSILLEIISTRILASLERLTSGEENEIKTTRR